MKRILITGGCGFLGSNLAERVLREGDDLYILDDLSRLGSNQNLKWLQTKGKLQFHPVDIRNASEVDRVVEQSAPDWIFHLAGQVAMTTSLEHPRRDFEINALGSLNILEAVRRHCPKAVVIYSSTNKVYGSLESFRLIETETRYTCPDRPNGFDEQTQLEFHSPYGCSKGSADQYMLDYARIFGVRAVVFRHSSIFGGRQFSTSDQGWIGWFVEQAIKTQKGLLSEPFTISGSGKQVRDVLFVDDLIECYFRAAEKIEYTAGQAYNIGGGMDNSFSLLELFSDLERLLSTRLHHRKIDWRQSDQKVFVADITKAKRDFNWASTISKEKGLQRMIEWVGQKSD